MEAKYENSELLRLEVLNGIIALAKSIGFNQSEMAKSITIVVERENGETVTEYLSGTEIKTIVTKYLAECENEKEID